MKNAVMQKGLNHETEYCNIIFTHFTRKTDFYKLIFTHFTRETDFYQKTFGKTLMFCQRFV